MGLSQLQRLKAIVEERNRLHQRYQALLEPLSVNLLQIPEACVSALHLAVIRLAGDDSVQHRRVFEGLRVAGVGVQLHYTPVHLQPDYRRLGFGPGDFPESEAYARSAISLPLYPGLREGGARAGGGSSGGIAQSAMNILFVHQGFPSQYRHIVRALAAQGSHRLVGMGIGPAIETLPQGVTYVQYGLTRGNTPGLHEWMLELDSKFIRAEACAKAAAQLRDQGFQPELICAHPGWGEALFLRDVWPKARLLCYQEFYYHARGVDLDFDPELQGDPSWEDCARLRLKNANPLLMLDAAGLECDADDLPAQHLPQGVSAQDYSDSRWHRY